MRDPARIPKLLAQLGELWAYNPDARLCQLVGNHVPAHLRGEDTYYVEDDELIAAFEKTLERYRNAGS